jgi:hypothetical protein
MVERLIFHIRIRPIAEFSFRRNTQTANSARKTKRRMERRVFLNGFALKEAARQGIGLRYAIHI